MSILKRRDPWWLLSLAAAAPMASPAQAQSYEHVAQSPAGLAQTHLAGRNRTAQEQEIPPGVTLRLEALYDSNVAESRAAIGPQPVAPEDELLKPAVLLNLQRVLGRETAFLNGGAGYDFYRQNTFLNRERVDLEGGLRAPIAKCNGVLSGAFSRHQSALDELTSVVKNTEDLETVSLQDDCTRTVGFAPLFTVSQGWTQNSDLTRKTVDHRLFSAEGGVVYARPSLGQVSLFGAFEDATFPNAMTDVAGVERENGYQAYAGGVRLTRRLGARIEGEALLSYQVLTPDLPTAKGFSGLTYSLDMTYRASARLRAHVILSRENAPSNRLGSAFSTDDAYSAAMVYEVGARLRLALDGAYRRRTYGSLTPIAVTDLTRESVKSGGATLTYDLTAKLSLALKVEEEGRAADVTRLGYTSTRVGLTAEERF